MQDSINYLRSAGITAAWCDEDGAIRVRVRGVQGTVALRSDRDPAQVLATIGCSAKECTFLVPFDAAVPRWSPHSTQACPRLHRALIAGAFGSLVIGAMLLPSLPFLWGQGVLFGIVAVAVLTAGALWPEWRWRRAPKSVVLGTDGMQFQTGVPAYVPWENVKQLTPTEWVVRVAPDRWAPLHLPHYDFGFRSRVSEILATRGKAMCRSLDVPRSIDDSREGRSRAKQVDLSRLRTPGDGADSYRPLAMSVTDSELVDMVEDASVASRFRTVAARLAVARGVAGAEALVLAAANATVHVRLAAALSEAAAASSGTGEFPEFPEFPHPSSPPEFPDRG